MKANTEKIRIIFFSVGIIIGIIYLLSHFANPLIKIILPFAIAWLFAEFLSSPVNYLTSQIKIPKFISCILVVVGFYSALFAFIYIIAGRLFSEISQISGYISVLNKNFPSYLENAKKFFSENLPFFDFSRQGEFGFEDFFQQTLSQITGTLTSYLATTIPSIIGAIPQFFIFATITILATCYFTSDFKKINGFIIFQFPQKYKRIFFEIKNQFFDIVSKYLGAYFAIAAITFSELFAGLIFIRREYAFVLALIITLIDILPIFGSGFILVPWGIIEFFIGNKISSLELILLYLVITVVRQIIEPKIVGSYMGLHPLITLLSVYAGGKIMGVIGIFLFPIITVIIKNLNDKNVLNLYSQPPENMSEQLISVKKKYKKFKSSD